MCIVFNIIIYYITHLYVGVGVGVGIGNRLNSSTKAEKCTSTSNDDTCVDMGAPLDYLGVVS